MPLKKDSSGRRWVEMELELPGTPEQIWQAMATGPGYSAWFVPTEIEEHEGGAVKFDLGMGVISSGRVTAWQPPFRFACEEIGWSGEAPPLATEIIIEARSGGTCTVRMVHSLFTEKDDWDKEIEGMTQGWPPFFDILRIYLQRFAGMRAASARPTGNFAGTQDAAWEAVLSTLGLASARVGEEVDTSACGGPRLVGVVENLTEAANNRGITLRLQQPSPGVALIGTYGWAGKIHVAVSLFFYGDTAEEVLAREQPKWDAWMNEHFKAEPPN